MYQHASTRVRAAIAVLVVIFSFGQVRLAEGQSLQPALFVTDHIATAPQFGNYASIKSFTVSPEGVLTPVGTYYTNDYPYELSLSPSGRYLAVGHASALTNEDLIVFEVNADASLTMFAVVTVQSSPFEIDWIDDSTLLVLETSNGDSGVWTYQFDPNAAMPQKIVPLDDARTGVFSSQFRLHPSLPVVYVADSPLIGTNFLRSFEIAPDGALSTLQSLAVAPYALDIDITPNERYLYMVSGAGSDGVQGFELDGSGMMTPLAFSPFPTPDGPASHIKITPSGGIAIVFHGATETIRSFSISPDDGSLFNTGFSFNIGGNGIFEAIEVFNNLLFVTRNSGSGIDAGILIYNVHIDGSFSPVGDGDPIFAGTRPYFMETWNPLAIQLGDINADGAVDELDIPLFAAALVGDPVEPVHVIRSDINLDGSTDGLDAGPFVNAYLSPVAAGACCFADAPCQVVSQDECVNTLGGTFGGVGVPCSVCPALPAPAISFVFGQGPPYCNNLATPYQFFVFGENFSSQADLRFVHDTLPDILPFNLEVLDPTSVGADFDFNGVPAGTYQLLLTNPDGQFVFSPDDYVIGPCN